MNASRQSPPADVAGIATTFGDLTGGTDGTDAGRPPLVFLHGLTFDRRIWAPVLREYRAIDPTRKILNLDLPGHGESPAAPAHDLEVVIPIVHRAIQAAGLGPPVIVGHSISAVIATVYAAQFPCRGVVNVDQSLKVAPFARFVQSLATQLRGPDFPGTWRLFEASFHTELLPADMRELVATTSQPRQDIVVSYWQDLLERDPADVAELARASLAELYAEKLPYVIVAGADPDPAYSDWLSRVLPLAQVVVWPGSGHFPHLAHPGRFAALLTATPP
jgi:pimeloyl-ACP methyl ester carboxylesterase